MILTELKEMELSVPNNISNAEIRLSTFSKNEVYIYPKSINNFSNVTFFIGKIFYDKMLFLITKDKDSKLLEGFEGEYLDCSDEKTIIKQCPQNHSNAEELKKIFPFTKPILLGLFNSFGFGDRIGLSNQAHIRALNGSDFKPVLAQQSIRELSRTKRTADQVMDAAIWAVFQEGYKSGYGADADHLKTTEDIDLMINAGFTMFTFDPGEFVKNEADNLNLVELEKSAEELNWDLLNDSLQEIIIRYTSKQFDLNEGLIINPTYEDVLRATVKYGNAIAHIKKLFDHLSKTYNHLPYEVEISVDETESVTSPFEHFLIASELNRLGVAIISLAPRFIGDFEKGIDYKGDLNIFKQEYLKHVKIAEYFGSYKISLHSGSDKFGVYKAIGQLKRGYTHVKTAGTSYLEALKVVAFAEPDEFRKILDYSKLEYEKEKNSYHVSADVKNVNSSESYTNEQLLELFNQNDARQILHVTFGRVLTSVDENGKFLFKEKIYECLIKNEDVHYKFLINHFKNHLDPFN